MGKGNDRLNRWNHSSPNRLRHRRHLETAKICFSNSSGNSGVAHLLYCRPLAEILTTTITNQRWVCPTSFLCSNRLLKSVLKTDWGKSLFPRVQMSEIALPIPLPWCLNLSRNCRPTLHKPINQINQKENEKNNNIEHVWEIKGFCSWVSGCLFDFDWDSWAFVRTDIKTHGPVEYLRCSLARFSGMRGSLSIRVDHPTLLIKASPS